MKNQQLTGSSTHKVHKPIACDRIEAMQNTAIRTTWLDVRSTLDAARHQHPSQTSSTARPEPIQAGAKDRHVKNSYLSAEIFFMFSDPLVWPEKVGEIAMDEVCPGCVAALAVSNGQKCKEARFVGDDALYCFGFCEQAVN